MWKFFFAAMPFVCVTAVAVLFQMYWKAAVERSDDDRLTNAASFLIFLALSAVVLWVRQPR